MAFVSDNLAYIDLLTEFAHTTGSTVALAVGAPRWHAWLQFGLQFTTVPCRPERTGQRRWSSLNRSERPRAELLMLLRSRAVQALAVCCQYCCQAAGHGLSRTDNSGASAQHMTGNGRSWTICPRARPRSRAALTNRFGCQLARPAARSWSNSEFVVVGQENRACSGSTSAPACPGMAGPYVRREVGVSMMTQIRGASNGQAKRELGWKPCYESWREGFRVGLGDA